MSLPEEYLRTNKRRVMRTIRCKNRNVIGTLANLITAAAGVGADIGIIETVAMGELYNVRDISVVAEDEDHMQAIVKRISEVPNVKVVQVIDEVLNLHQGGKIQIKATYPVKSLEDLRKVYTPGVAQVTTLIKRDPQAAHKYTSIPRNVALVTNGSRVLGLGNMGPVASMPVMEGKAALFAQFTGLNMFPILVDTRDPKKFVDTVLTIACGFGAIQLEDIEAPACFEIEDELIKRLEIPVMHDDQHGTATVVLAAAINACKLTNKDIRKLRIGQVGLGAAGQAIARLIAEYVAHPVDGSDTSQEACDRYASFGGNVSTMENIFKDCDLVICTTGRRNLVKPEMIRKGQIVLALSNPYPEITIQDALAAGAAFASDGTRVNNLLGYPGIFKGAIETRSRRITNSMLIAASEAIAAAAGDRELVPSALDLNLHKLVSEAVAAEAVRSGIARTTPEHYYHRQDDSLSYLLDE